MRNYLLIGALFMTLIPGSIMAEPSKQIVAEALSWQPISKAPKELISAVNAKGEVPTARFSKIMNLKQMTPLYVIDINSADECGAAGCAVEGYVRSGSSFIKVLELLTDGRVLPPKIDNDFVSVANLKNSMPCLDFPGASSETARWCFNGKTYVFAQRITSKTR
jgi:hypothetical protein